MLSFFFGDIELHLQNTYQDGHWDVPCSKNHCAFNVLKMKKSRYLVDLKEFNVFAGHIDLHTEITRVHFLGYNT